MSDQEDDASPKLVPIGDLKMDPAAEDLLDSPAMEPYLNLAMAIVGGKDTGPAMEELAARTLEKRYVWRVASALKWAFADFDTESVAADRKTMSAEDRRRLIELLAHRPLQFCLFLSALFGEKQMELMLISAIRNTRKVMAQSDQRD